MGKLNILIVSDTIYDYISGAANVALRLIDGLSKKHKITVITSSTGKYEEYVQDIQNKVKVYRFPGFKIPVTKGAYFGFPRKKKIREILKDVDVVQTFIPTYLTYRVIKEARKLDIPIVSGYHTQPENVLGNIGLNLRWLNYVFMKYVIWFHNHSYMNIAPSTFAYNYLVKYGCKKPIEIISNGVPTDIFKPIDSKQIIERHNLNGYNVILFVGRLMKEKDLMTLCSAFLKVNEDMPKTKLIIVGIGYMKEKIEDYARFWDIKDIILTGKVSYEELPLYYNVCDVFVLPSLIELQGMVVLEAMACRKAVIVSDSDLSASKEMVDEDMLFNAKDHKGLANKIIYVLKNDKFREKQAVRNYNFVRNKHSMVNVIGEYEKIYKSLYNK